MKEYEIANKPFLRWAGGKNWLVKDLAAFLSKKEFNTYHEPFLGGGSLFFALSPEKARLSDLNAELIEAYIGLRDYPEQTINQINKWPVCEEQYYEVRSKKPRKPHTKAARFIYLNRTSFNGIYRVNRSGEYNVPYGHRNNYKFDFDRLRSASLALKNAHISAKSFQETIKDINEGDFVFLDPPYTVSHNKNGFIEYNKTLFSIEDQRLLKDYLDAVNQKGAFYVLTNAAHDAITEIFKDESNLCITVSRNCVLGGTNAKRGQTEEFVFSNMKDLRDGFSYGK